MGYLFGHADVDRFNGSLASAWKFDNNFVDYRGSNNGTDHGTSDVAGKHNRARRFVKAESDYIDFGNVLNLGIADFSLSFWIQFSVLGVNEMIFSKIFDGANIWYVWKNPLDRLRMSGVAGGINFVNINVAAASKFTLVDTWYDVLIVGDRDAVPRVYINGSLVVLTTGTITAANADNAGNLYAGRRLAAYSNMTLDEPSEWLGAALDQPAATALWNGGNGRFYHVAPQAQIL